MGKTDTHKLVADAQQGIYYQVIRLKKQSRKRLETSEITDIHLLIKSFGWTFYKNGGRTALKIKRYFNHPIITSTGAAID